MRFSTIFTVIAAGALALAGAVPDMIEKRTGDITSIFNTLNDQCNDILPQFGDCYDDDCTTSIVADLNVAIKACTSSLGGISGLILLPPPGLVSLVANIVVNIVVALNDQQTSCGANCPGILDIFATVNVSLSACLTACFGLVVGLVVLVAAELLVLLPGLVSVCGSLGLTTILSVCGL